MPDINTIFCHCFVSFLFKHNYVIPYLYHGCSPDQFVNLLISIFTPVHFPFVSVSSEKVKCIPGKIPDSVILHKFETTFFHKFFLYSSSATSFGIALPSWLVSKENSMWVSCIVKMKKPSDSFMVSCIVFKWFLWATLMSYNL